MAMSNAVLEAALKAAIARLVAALANKDAANSLKLEGKTLAEITTLILQGKAATAGTADNALALGGKTLAELQAEYGAAITDAIAAITKEDIGLGNVENYGVATEAEALAGATDKYVTAFLADKIAQAKIDALVGAAPETLDTINEIAAALNNDPDIINTMLSQIGSKETPEGAQAKADAAQAAAAADATTKAGQALTDAKAYTDSEIAELDAAKLGKLDQAADSAMLEGKTLDQILALSGVTPDDFAAPPLNVFLGVDYASMGSHPKGEWSGPAVITDMGSPEMVATGAVTGFLYVSVVESVVGGVAAKVVTRRVELGHATEQGQTFQETFTLTVGDAQVTGTGFKTAGLSAAELEAALLEITGGSTETLQEISDNLAAFIANKATGAEAIAGTDDAKYITALALKAKVDDAIAALVDGAPLALDTLKELALALQDSESELAALVLVVDGKLGKLETAADSAKLGGKTPAELATERDVAIAAVTDPMQTQIDTVGDDVDALAQAITDAFNEASDALEAEPV